MSKATEAVRPRMAGGWQHSQDRDHPTAGVLAPASVEDTLSILPQQVKAKISAGIDRASRIHEPDCSFPCLPAVHKGLSGRLLTQELDLQRLSPLQSDLLYACDYMRVTDQAPGYALCKRVRRNVNKPLANLLAWPRATKKTDVVCLQELKTTDVEFPADAIRRTGYDAAWRGHSPVVPVRLPCGGRRRRLSCGTGRRGVLTACWVRAELDDPSPSGRCTAPFMTPRSRTAPTSCTRNTSTATTPLVVPRRSTSRTAKRTSLPDGLASNA